jgi:hypothetical protein
VRSISAAGIGREIGALDGEAPAVDQHEIAHRAEAAQVEIRVAARDHVRLRAAVGCGHELRCLGQHLFDVQGAGKLHVVRTDGGDRRAALLAGSRDARTRHDDLLQ